MWRERGRAMAVAGGEGQRAPARRAEVRAFATLAALVGAGPYTAADVLDHICGEVRTSFGFGRAAVLRHDAASGTVTAVASQGLEWQDAPVAVRDIPFVADALARREAVAVRGDVCGLDSPAAVPLLVSGRCPAFVVADRPAEDLDDEALDLLTALGSMGAVLLERADHDGQLAELQHIDRLKTDFLGIASHELRTPIAVVHGIASTLHLRGSELSGEQVLDL